MCLAALAFGLNPQFPFVLLANRDEVFDRPAAPMGWWPASGSGLSVLAGRDLLAGGTWLGLTADGRMALVTNVREPGRVLAASPSRGELVQQWLQAGQHVNNPAALQRLVEVPRNGFNLLVGDLAGNGPAQVRWLSNRPQARQQAVAPRAEPGVHGVSNAALDTPWPKLQRLKQRLRILLTGAATVQDLQTQGLAALTDAEMAADAQLPATGLPLGRERQLSPVFIRVVGDDPGLAVYGTRCSTVVVVRQRGAQRSLHVIERSFGPAGDIAGHARYEWNLPQA